MAALPKIQTRSDDFIRDDVLFELKYDPKINSSSDIAVAVCFISSPLSDFMTGTTFRIDGGATPTV